MLVHPKNRGVRRIWIAVEVAALAAALGWLGWRALNQPGLAVELIEVDGYTEDLGVWMRFGVTLELHNPTSQTLGVERVSVEPDLDGFNEAYGQAVPFLTPPLLIERDSTTRHTALVTLLNAAQLPERTYDMVLRVRVETEEGETLLREFTAQYDHSRTPSQRRLRLL